MNGIINDSQQSESLYQSLYIAIKSAAVYETNVDSFLRQHTGNDLLKKQVDALQTGDLPESIGKLISVLDIYMPFQSLGKYIRNFADAEFVIRNLEEVIILQLEKADVEAWKVISGIITCCEQLQGLAEQKPDLGLPH